jgi:hypothetical protein
LKYYILNNFIYLISIIFILDDLKTMVYAETNIPCCLQNFSGWPNNQHPSNKDKLSKLNLPDRFKLNLNSDDEDLNQELNGRYDIY